MAAIPAYRNLLRAARVAFEGGDKRVLQAAKDSIRGGFREKLSLKPNTPATAEAIKNAEDVAVILRENVVQGKKVGNTYKLRIHRDTERGDNDTVKLPNGKKVKMPEGKYVKMPNGKNVKTPDGKKVKIQHPKRCPDIN
ncbi:Mitochondrial zinc maintenance protein 1, mitochondrial [Diatrype stigma]|uniref:Mitochondrial zinc maintenance protein 1, mitochondrial n=1 Tax=Diatrype stigma TaxID=117547 RepID=A0AAN9UYI4_9PEZI